MEYLLEELSFEGSEHPEKRVVIDQDYVSRRLAGVVADTDLSRYIL
jgi:ATP-dependent HslUV protease ATP-binding subunit HslU